MRNALLAISALLLSCSLFGGTPPTTPDTGPWPQILDCGPDIADIATTISTILLSSEQPGQEATETVIGPTANSKLEQLAIENGKDVVACLVDLFQREWTRPGASATPERAAAAQRAASFLSLKGVTVKSNQAFEP
jgi:hypothetical protein